MNNLHNIVPIPNLSDDEKIGIAQWFKKVQTNAVISDKRIKYFNGKFEYNYLGKWVSWHPINNGWTDEGKTEGTTAKHFNPNMIIIGE